MPRIIRALADTTALLVPCQTSTRNSSGGSSSVGARVVLATQGTVGVGATHQQGGRVEASQYSDVVVAVLLRGVTGCLAQR